MPDYKDYYAILGLKKQASADEIKQAYRRLAKEHHPDLQTDKNKAKAGERFKEINEAYEVLSDPQKRSKYDEIGPGWEAAREAEEQERKRPRRPAPEGGGAGFSDFFEDLFGGEGRFGGAFGGGGRRAGDVEAEMALSLEDAVRGGEKRFTIQGSAPCPTCGGTGRKGRSFCPTCGGAGEVRRERTITTHIPQHVRDGTRLRLRGQGSPAVNGREAGDLFLVVHLLPHPKFKVDGSDLETTVTIMPWDAALGGEINVPTLEGPVRIKIPAGTHSGRRLRISGKGLSKEGGARGDLYAETRIDNPENAGPGLMKLYEQLRDAAR